MALLGAHTLTQVAFNELKESAQFQFEDLVLEGPLQLQTKVKAPHAASAGDRSWAHDPPPHHHHPSSLPDSGRW